MATWAELERADRDLAAFGRERFEARVAFHATLMADGSPRVHPVSPWFATGLVMVSFRARSPKVAEIRRDGRYAMHSVLPAEDHEGSAGEFLLRGWMEQISEEHPAVVQRPYAASYPLASFACSVEEAVATTYPGGGSPVYRRWRA
jgi:hypothetical protein